MTPPSPLKDRTLVYLHIPKTGGMTFQRALAEHFDPFAIYLTRFPYDEAEAHLRSLPEWEKRRIRFLAGHLPFGIHQTLPRPGVTVTLLRNPVDRVTSHYFFALRARDHVHHDIIRRQKLSLAAYLDSGLSPQLDNCQTRMLSGRDATHWLRGTEPCSSEDLDRARRHLATDIAVAGITELFEETLVLLGLLFHWRMRMGRRRNVTPQRPDAASLPPESVAAIARHNEFDTQLYEFSRARFRQHLDGLGGRFRQSLRAFRLRHRFRSRWSGMLWRLRRRPSRLPAP